MNKRCGYVAIVGSPNVGKSTLFNRLVGQKLSSISYKPQTTRHRIVGVKTEEDAQFVFVDTPGIHLGGKKLINRVLNKNATNVLHDVHLILWLVDLSHWTQEEDHINRLLKEIQCPVIMVVNKVDKLAHRDKVLGILANLASKGNYAELIPISAMQQGNLDQLITISKKYLPESEFFYPELYVTDRDQEFIITEAIRESIFIYVEKELPYATHVELEEIKHENERMHIGAVIWVEKGTQKAIIIGRKGDMLKKIGSRARQALQQQLGERLHLQLWVKVKEDWQNNPQIVGKYET